MTVEQIIAVVTIVITYIFGELSKRFEWFTKDNIPFQNLLIGFFAGVIAFICGLTDNVITSICICILSAFATGGVYDLGKSGDKSDK